MRPQKQDLAYSNEQIYNVDATVEVVRQLSRGTVTSTHDDIVVLQDEFSYPLTINLTATDTSFDNCQWRGHSPAQTC